MLALCWSIFKILDVLLYTSCSVSVPDENQCYIVLIAV